MIVAFLLSATMPTIPADFRGTWGEARYACAPGALHTRLTVKRRSLSDGEFEADILRVRQVTDHRIVFDALWDAESAKRATYRFTLGAAGHTLTTEVTSGDATHDGTRKPVRYIRCGAAR